MTASRRIQIMRERRHAHPIIVRFTHRATAEEVDHVRRIIRRAMIARPVLITDATVEVTAA